MTKLADIARLSGVSPAVVSRVVNRDPNLRINDRTRQRVLRAISETGYVPNFAARSLRSSCTEIVAVLVSDVTNPVYSEIVRGAQTAASTARRALLLGDISSEADSAGHLTDLIGGRGVDGLIIQASGSVNDQLFERVAGQGVPVVLLQSRLRLAAHLVMLPDRLAAKLATAHLTELGHRHIGCVATQAGLTFTEERMAGFLTEISRADLPEPHCPLEYAASNITAGATAAATLLGQDARITALVCFNVLAAIGAHSHIRAAGMSVPGDISIVALHDIDFAAYLRPPLTTVSMPLYEMGRRAVEILCEGSPEAGGETTIDSPAPSLIRRSSTAPPRNTP